MADLYLTPAEKYTAALGGFYYGDLPEPGTVYTQLIKDILDGSTPDKVPKNILARFIYSLYISDLGDPYPRYELAKLLYWKLHDITPTKSGSVLTVTIDGKEDYMTINTDLSRLWYKVLFGSKTDVITEFPYIFNTIQNKLSDWELFGNVSVSGTPTPDNPVMSEGTGERTGNLADVIRGKVPRASDGSLVTFKGLTTEYVPFHTGDILSVSFEKQVQTKRFYVFYYSGDTLLNTKDLVYGNSISSYGVSEAVDRIRIRIDYSEVEVRNVMLNTGSTPLSYEPYGYKIPISSASTTTSVYLGEVQTTRKIKKLVLTGEETWEYSGGFFYTHVNSLDFRNTTSGLLCSHLPVILRDSFGGQPSIFWGRAQAGDVCLCISNTITTLDAFKSYLSAQYAAGTPVTVWYVLATEETGIVNEPLMKIGNYADCMSKTQTGIDIPTVVGQNTLDVLTTVKPSSMSIEYTSADENRSRSKRISLLKSPLKKGMIK